MAIPAAPPSYAEVMASKEQLFSSQQSYSRQQPYPGQHSYPMQQPYPGQHSYPMQQPYPGQHSYPMQQPYPGQQPGPQPPTMPVHPSWTFVQPNPGSGFSSSYGPSTFNPYSDPSSTGSINAFAVDSWSSQKIRHVFIQKVYAILMAQLLVTFGIVAVFTFCDPVRTYVRNNHILYYTSFAVFITTYLILVCCSGIRRRYPWNLILLAVFFDFTSCHGLMFGLLMVLFITGIVMVFTVPFGYLPWLQTFYAGLGALVFTMFLAYDTQLLLGNKRYSLSPEEHVFGALCLYTDIIYIFMFLLQLFGHRD
ncbi:protein lifeguard 2a isoform X3 [Stegostoma tigrinum]|uniref:protein lifeguard 2a isoform X3 n=1 Tax=Stegostoma tigrinum TaxID=3053191 RepID=UPI0028701A6B|nr:protein lifeguard 2a isoform X3 [Stegostoma tigrinum]